MPKELVIQEGNTIFEELDRDVTICTADLVSNTSVYIKAQSITSTEVNLSSCYVHLYAPGNVELQNIKTRGHLSERVSNSAFIINSNCRITIEDCIFDQFGINCIEICSDPAYTCKGVTIRNCVFSEDIELDSIVIHKTDKNARINIVDCEFKSVAHVLKFCNQLNHSGIEINLNNCKVVTGGSRKMSYEGIVVFSDDIATSVMDAREKNKFRYNKITVNFCDIVNQAGLVINPEDQRKVIGTFEKGQIAYIFNAFEGKVSFKENPKRYPIFTFVDTITEYVENEPCGCDCNCGKPDKDDDFIVEPGYRPPDIVSGGCGCGGSSSSDDLCGGGSSSNNGSCCNNQCYCCSYRGQCSNANQGYKPGLAPPTEIPTVKREQQIVNGGWEDWNTAFEGIGSQYWNLSEGFVYENIAKEIARTFPNVKVDFYDPVSAINMLKKYGVMKYQKNYPMEILLDKLVKDKYIYKRNEGEQG